MKETSVRSTLRDLSAEDVGPLDRYETSPLTAGARVYYENYWSSDTAPPDEDPLTEERVKRFLGSLDSRLSILDLGCGNGHGTRLLNGSGRRVVGLDVSYRALHRASELGKNGTYLQAACDAALPFASNSFDAVYSAEVIEHVLDPKAMIMECHRVLKPGGILFVTTPYHGLIKNLMIVAAAFDRHFSATGSHIRFFTVGSLCRLLVTSNFSIERIFYLGRFWPVWMNMAVDARKL